MIELFAFVKKFWPFGVIIALAFFVLIQRNTISRQDGEIHLAEVKTAELTAANKTQADALATVKQMQIDNDAIAEAVALKLSSNQTREVHTREIIERLKDDPQVRDWASVPVPGGVREALRSR